jgi:hypothetical protein
MDQERATGAQRVGFVFALIEAGLLGVLAAMHFGADWTIAGMRYAAPFLFPAGIIEGLLAIAVLLAVAIPGDGGVRAGRVLAAEILTIIGVFVGQVALTRTAGLIDVRGEVYYAVILALALATIALVSSPAYRRRIAVVHDHP